jgi:hypothetical protein
MAKKSIAAVSNDFDEVVALLKDRKILPSAPSQDMLRIAKAIHANTYSLILWRFRLPKLSDHAQIFVEEIASDALQVLPQVLMGYSKTSKLLIRCIAENALRHIYFSDHPIEFERMNREKKWFLTLDGLCDYAKNHPAFLKTEKKFDAINQIVSLYSELSAGVHGRAVRDLEMRTALRKIIYHEAAAKIEANLLHKCTQATNFLLAIFHCKQMRNFQLEDRRIILRAMPVEARSIWNEYE